MPRLPMSCIALALWVPWTASRLAARYDVELRARAEATPLVVGAPGNRYDLTLAALYFRPTELDTVPYSAFEAIAGNAIPPTPEEVAANIAPTCSTCAVSGAACEVAWDVGEKKYRHTCADISCSSGAATAFHS